jgi:hypothetical protein
MDKKAAIELSMNFLIIIIISIVIFGFGIWIANKFFTEATGMQLVFDQRTEAEIEQLMDDGSRVAIPFERAQIYNGKADTIGMGILNVAGINPATFRVSINFSKAFASDNRLLCDGEIPGLGIAPDFGRESCGYPDTWLRTTAGDGSDTSRGLVFTRTIDNYQSDKFLVGFEVIDAPAGTYVFNVRACYDDGRVPGIIDDDCTDTYPADYDKLHKIYVIVP